MRRAAILCVCLGLLGLTLGCKVVTGQHDCTYDPASMQLPPTDAHLPVATVGSPIVAAPTTPGK